MPWVNLLFIAFEMSQQADRAQVISIRKMNRFRFSDYRFAEFVRKRMSDALVQFDVNANHLFEENEIREALLHILNEDPNEIYYVVQNVFRYDKDNDKRITYKEFVRNVGCRSISAWSSISENWRSRGCTSRSCTRRAANAS